VTFNRSKMLLTVIATLYTVFVFSQDQNIRFNGNSSSAFRKNLGQVLDQKRLPNSDVLYLLSTPGLNVQLKKTGFSYDVYEKEQSKVSNDQRIKKAYSQQIKSQIEKNSKLLFHRIDVNFLNSNPNVQLVEKFPTSNKVNYYNLPGIEDGITNVPSFGKVIYRELYPGINLEFFVPKDAWKPVEYNFILRPGSNIEDIKMQFTGADVSLENNILEFRTRHGKMKEILPASWFGTDKNKIAVKINFVQITDSVFGFKMPQKYKGVDDTLTIDPTPVREWATYFGGEEDESYFIGDVKTDLDGNPIITGFSSSSSNIATTGPPESLFENTRFAYLAKFDPSGILLWSSYYGGLQGASFYSVSVDNSNNIICTGESSSKDNIATTNAHQTSLNDSENNENHGDGIIVKFNSAGIRLWGTYFGGETMDYLTSVITDEQDNIYTVGSTASHQNISTPGSFKEIGDAYVHGHWNGILAKFDKHGNRIWATFYAGEEINEVAIDKQGNVYFVGTTYSFEEISTPGAYQENLNYDGMSWPDAFIAKFNPSGERIWGTYYGGTDYDFAQGIALDSNNNVIISGDTRSSTDIATPGAFKETKNFVAEWDSFLAKFDSSGQIIWSTFYGGNDTESWGYNKVDVDLNNNIFLLGDTNSSTGISTTNGFQSEWVEGSMDLFLTKFSEDGERIWGTYYGGNSSESSLNLDITDKGEIYLLGWTFSNTGISTPGAHQTTHGGKRDAFLVKFKDCLSSFTANVPSGVCEGEDLKLAASGAKSYSWTGPNNFTSTKANPVITNASAINSGTYYLTLSSGNGCDDLREFEIFITPKPVVQQLPDLVACEGEFSTGIAPGFDLFAVTQQVIGSQTNLIVSYLNGKGEEIAKDQLNNYINVIQGQETITVRVANELNPDCLVEKSFNLLIEPIPDSFVVEDITICDSNSDGIAETNLKKIAEKLTADNNNLRVTFFDANDNVISISPSGTFTNSIPFKEIITARMINNSTECYSETSFNIIIGPAPVAYPLQDLIGCDENADGISEYFDISQVANRVVQDQTGLELTYFSDDETEILDFSSPYINIQPFQQTVIVRVTNPKTSCFSETTLTLKTSESPEINTPITIYACDEGGGIANFRTATWTQQIIGNQTGLKVSWYDSNGNPLPSPLPEVYRNKVAHSETLTVKVEDDQNPLCSTETQLYLVVNKKQELNLQDIYSICGLEPSLKLKIPGNFDVWEWITEDGEILSTASEVVLEQEGIYVLSVGTFQNGILCEETHVFKLTRSALPQIREINFREWSSDNYIEIIASGEADLEYSIDGINYTDSNYFEDLTGGSYTVYARDKKGCGIASKELTLLDYPKYFTPNNDGYNDLWQITGIDQGTEVHIFIYDRYGKLLKQLSSISKGWDGTYNGKSMPADDYWFSAQLPNGKIYKNHFSLIR